MITPDSIASVLRASITEAVKNDPVDVAALQRRIEPLIRACEAMCADVLLGIDRDTDRLICQKRDAAVRALCLFERG